jgi:hypothetical protein
MEATMKAKLLCRHQLVCLLTLASVVIAPAWAATPDEPATAPLARDEPHHHLLFQNEFVRIMRVVIPPGDATLWHEHNFDFGVVFVNGSKLRADLPTDPQGTERIAATKNFIFFDYDGKHFVHRVNNIDTTAINHQLAFELIPSRPMGFGASDRSAVPEYKMEVDNERVRMWRLQLAPGQTAAMIVQKAPGIRFVLSGDRFVETHGEGRAQDIATMAGDYAWLPGGALRSVTNAGVSPLELIEIELK